ncbi:MAG: maleylpyruvate isomerase N-terminal domain-containing protein [Acidimicrobiales bacterium]
MGRGGTVPGGAPASFPAAATHVVGGLAPLVDRDWSVPAGELAWSCRETVGHLVDCLLSYTLQVAARRAGDWLPVGEAHVAAGATPPDLLATLGAVSTTFSAVLATAPPATTASDGVVSLGVDDWAARGAYELLVHGYDIAFGLGGTVHPPSAICAWILSSPNLWMLDRSRATPGAGPWERLLLASGRAAPSA